MKFRTLRYFINESSRNLVRNRLMSVASILTVASCIFIVSVFYCLAANIDFFLNQLESSIGVTVFIDDGLTTEEVQTLYDKVMLIPFVAKASYITAQEALETFKQTVLEDIPALADGLEYNNPLRRSIEIEIEDLRNQDDVIKALGELYGVANIMHSSDLADTARTVSDVARAVCIALILILGIISIVIIINTIRITVNARRIEINIMKYVGATDWFIRWPFIIEGILIGLLGGLLPAILCWFLYGRVIDAIQNGLPVLDFVQFRQGHDIFSYLFPFALFLGMIIGMTGSVFSVRRHLKV